jgi:glycosyltransferase involved in cell wall biosynthesis
LRPPPAPSFLTSPLRPIPARDAPITAAPGGNGHAPRDPRDRAPWWSRATWSAGGWLARPVPPDRAALQRLVPTEIAHSIPSILGQTLADFELVILDDASADDSRAIARDWARRDRRIRLVESDTRLGVVGSADRVVREASAPVCARMDADDVSQPERLRAQWEALGHRPDVPLVGTLGEGIDGDGRTLRPRDRWRLLQPSMFAPFPHGSIMFRRPLFLGLGGYRPACTYWEDHDLYIRMATLGPILVLSDALYRYRFHTASATGRPSRRDRLLTAAGLMYRCLDRCRGGEDYTALLADDGADEGSLDPRVLFAVGAPRLWAGHRPGIARDVGRLPLRPPSPALIRTLVLALWGEMSPASLRRSVRTFIRLRDRLASAQIRDGSAVEWRPAGPPGGRPGRP